MTGGEHPAPQQRRLTARRLALLATVGSLGLGALFLSPTYVPQPTLPGLATSSAHAQNVTQEAQTVARPVGFADVVEKVKPAVISVRVKVETNPQVMGFDGEGLPPGLERFFRQFGQPDGGLGLRIALVMASSQSPSIATVCASGPCFLGFRFAGGPRFSIPISPSPRSYTDGWR